MGRFRYVDQRWPILQQAHWFTPLRVDEEANLHDMKCCAGHRFDGL
jgi:hypothetical protein